MDAKIYSYTVVCSSMGEFADKVPYVIALLEVGDKKITAMINGYHDGMKVAVGQKVQYVTERETGEYLFQFG